MIYTLHGRRLYQNHVCTQFPIVHYVVLRLVLHWPCFHRQVWPKLLLNLKCLIIVMLTHSTHCLFFHFAILWLSVKNESNCSPIACFKINMAFVRCAFGGVFHHQQLYRGKYAYLVGEIPYIHSQLSWTIAGINEYKSKIKTIKGRSKGLIYFECVMSLLMLNYDWHAANCLVLGLSTHRWCNFWHGRHIFWSDLQKQIMKMVFVASTIIRQY